MASRPEIRAGSCVSRSRRAPSGPAGTCVHLGGRPSTAGGRELATVEGSRSRLSRDQRASEKPWQKNLWREGQPRERRRFEKLGRQGSTNGVELPPGSEQG
jgi:hypothetical protein